MLLVAIVAGALGSMVGLGGGVFLVPLLSAFFGVPLKVAIAASAVSVIVNSLSGSIVYLKHGMTNIRLSLLMLLTTTLGAIAGGLIAVVASPNLLRIIFAVSLIAMPIAMLRRPTIEARRIEAPDPLRLGATYHDPALKADVTYTPRALGPGMAISAVAGVISGMLGIGGGAVQVPAMNLIMRVPVKAAAATSVLMVGTTVVASALIYYVNDLVDPSVTAPAVLGVLLGAQLGTRLARRVRGAVLVWVLALIMIYLALTMFLQALGIPMPGTR